MKTIKNQFAVIVGITLVLGLARVGARAEDTNGVTPPTIDITVAPAPKAAKPERPARPDKSGKDKVNATELKDIVKNFQEQKKEFMRQRKEEQADQRGKVREDLGSKSTVGTAVREEVSDSIAEAKRNSREQARKLADEAKEAAKEGRKRD